jgi:hypothetical protein
MAVVAQSAVTILRAWSDGGLALKDRKCVKARIVLVAQGGATNNIPASVFGMTVIEEIMGTDYSTGGKAEMSVSQDGSKAYLNKVSGADLQPTDISDTIQVIAKGF